MSETIATWLIAVLVIYAVVGLLFAVAFVWRGVTKVDPQAVGGSWGFRLAILPGVAAFWPLLARRWAAGRPPPEECNAHRQLARGGGSR